jgi:hypothetical protein
VKCINLRPNAFCLGSTGIIIFLELPKAGGQQFAVPLVYVQDRCDVELGECDLGFGVEDVHVVHVQRHF